MTLAITRKISPRFNECELTHISREPINLNLARQQHANYVLALQALGCEVIELPAEKDLPDSVFVEDTAFILPEVAIITRPGADSRKPEIESVAQALAPRRKLLRVHAPATVDGGDVLILGKNIFIGNSTRSNSAAVNQIQELLKPYGYVVAHVELRDCLHLKSALTKVDDQTLLINPNWADVSHFKHFRWIEIDAAEPYAANCLPINGQILYPTDFPKTAQKLEAHGYKLKQVDLSELAKAEGAVTCCSLIV